MLAVQSSMSRRRGQYQKLERQLDGRRNRRRCSRRFDLCRHVVMGGARMCCTMSFRGPSTGRRRSHGLSARSSIAHFSIDRMRCGAASLDLWVPGGREGLQHVGGVDLGDRPGANGWEGVPRLRHEFCGCHRARQPPRFCSSTRCAAAAKWERPGRGTCRKGPAASSAAPSKDGRSPVDQGPLGHIREASRARRRSGQDVVDLRAVAARHSVQQTVEGNLGFGRAALTTEEA